MFSDFSSGKRVAASSVAALQRAETVFLFVFGGLGYGLLEVLWRGRTHWSMLLCGGLAVLLLRRISRTALPFWAQCLAGAGSITALELAVGLVLNRWLQLAVWDYSELWGNLWGQICPAFSAAWLLLSALMLLVLRTLPPWDNTAADEPKDGQSPP